jgi:SP family general alpha glucoside:H+ symporter-like MFS transporter
VVQLGGLFLAFYFVERIGRRTLVLVGPLFLAALNMIIGGLGFLPNSSAVGSALIALFCIWTFIYALSLAPIVKFTLLSPEPS